MEKLRIIRITNRMSCQKMADKLNISKVYYWQLENKKRRLNYIMAIKIADIFGMKPDELFYEDTKKDLK